MRAVDVYFGMKWIIATLCCLLLSSCYKRQMQPREAFTLTGRVVDRNTGQALSGAIVQLETDDNTFGGFFSSTNEAGIVATDDSGRFAMIPLYFSDNQNFDLTVTRAGYLTQSFYNTREEIIEAGSTFDYETIPLRPQ